MTVWRSAGGRRAPCSRPSRSVGAVAPGSMARRPLRSMTLPPPADHPRRAALRSAGERPRPSGGGADRPGCRCAGAAPGGGARSGSPGADDRGPGGAGGDLRGAAAGALPAGHARGRGRPPAGRPRARAGHRAPLRPARGGGRLPRSPCARPRRRWGEPGCAADGAARALAGGRRPPSDDAQRRAGARLRASDRDGDLRVAPALPAPAAPGSPSRPGTRRQATDGADLVERLGAADAGALAGLSLRLVPPEEATRRLAPGGDANERRERAPGARSEAAARREPPPAAANPAIDIDRIVERVQRELKRRERFERERKGLF